MKIFITTNIFGALWWHKTMKSAIFHQQNLGGGGTFALITGSTDDPQRYSIIRKWSHDTTDHWPLSKMSCFQSKVQGSTLIEHLKGLAHAKIIKKSVILYQLF